MENLLSTLITQEACEGFKEYDETFDRMIPTANATLMNVSFEIHPNFFEDEGYNAIAPLALKVATYDIFSIPENREALVEAIAQGIEMTSTTRTKWIARKGKAITRESHHQPKLVITWSEDQRIFQDNT